MASGETGAAFTGAGETLTASPPGTFTDGKPYQLEAFLSELLKQELALAETGGFAATDFASTCSVIKGFFSEIFSKVFSGTFSGVFS